MNYILKTKNLTKQYNKNLIINNLNLNLPQGKIYGLLGRNGAGKTTIMKMILNLTYPTSGSIYLFGKKSLIKSNQTLNKVGSIIETPGFYSNLTAYDNLKILNLLKKPKSKTSNIDRALKIVGLDQVKDKTFGAYSLGMKQRLGIAAAIMHKPKLLILDEPINGLDPIGIHEIRKMLINLSKNQHITILISSHVLNEIEQMADIIGIIHQGNLIKEIDMNSFKQTSFEHLNFTVSDPNLAANLLKTKYNITDFTIDQNNILQIYNTTFTAGELNKIFVTNNITVSRITTKEKNLENYFANLIGDDSIA